MRIARLMVCVLCATLVCGTASALPIASHSDVGGLGTFVDLNTGNIWLRLDNFFDASPNDMKAAAAAAGFTIADTNTLQGLLSSLPLDSTETLWSQYAPIMGSAPYRELMWGAYDSGLSVPGWAWSSDFDTAWHWSPDGQGSGFGWDDIPNHGFLSADLNLWAYQAVPEPAFYQLGALLALGGLGVLRLRRRS
jgi:hypothetical protein